MSQSFRPQDFIHLPSLGEAGTLTLVDELIEVAQNTPKVPSHVTASIARLLVVGHNPGLTDLVHALAPAFAVDDLPTGAIVALDYPATVDWPGLGQATARLAYYDFPKNPDTPVTPR